jgi:hypothetical protein
MARKSITRSRIGVPDIIKKIREGERRKEIDNRKQVKEERTKARAMLKKLNNTFPTLKGLGIQRARD